MTGFHLLISHATYSHTDMQQRVKKSLPFSSSVYLLTIFLWQNSFSCRKPENTKSSRNKTGREWYHFSSSRFSRFYSPPKLTTKLQFQTEESLYHQVPFPDCRATSECSCVLVLLTKKLNSWRLPSLTWGWCRTKARHQEIVVIWEVGNWDVLVYIETYLIVLWYFMVFFLSLNIS